MEGHSRHGFARVSGKDVCPFDGFDLDSDRFIDCAKLTSPR